MNMRTLLDNFGALLSHFRPPTPTPIFDHLGIFAQFYHLTVNWEFGCPTFSERNIASIRVVLIKAIW